MGDPASRPTMAELAAGSSSATGLECSECGCRDWRVVKTRPSDDVIQRRRECRHCGHRMTTIEHS